MKKLLNFIAHITFCVVPEIRATYESIELGGLIIRDPVFTKNALVPGY